MAFRSLLQTGSPVRPQLWDDPRFRNTCCHSSFTFTRFPFTRKHKFHLKNGARGSHKCPFFLQATATHRSNDACLFEAAFFIKSVFQDGVLPWQSHKTIAMATVGLGAWTASTVDGEHITWDQAAIEAGGMSGGTLTKWAMIALS